MNQAFTITQSEAITRVAKMAAASSIDAHGYAVEDTIAYSFIIGFLFDSEDAEEFALIDFLPETMPAEFSTEYKAEAARLLWEVPDAR